MSKSIEWRRINKIDTILEWYKPPEVLVKYYPVGSIGCDKKGGAGKENFRLILLRQYYVRRCEKSIFARIQFFSYWAESYVWNVKNESLMSRDWITLS